jgi:Na+-transporting NADH:ubiquinone oxidoreductase subunit A
MSKIVKIKKGLDIPLIGQAEKILVKSETSMTYALKPADFHGLTPKLLVKPNEKVKKGTPLFFDKYKPEIVFVSPVSGEVTAINRGERRRVLEVVITPDNQNQSEKFQQADPKSLTTEQVKENLLKSGLWPLMRQRPYDVIANPKDTPKAIFISGFDTAPLAADFDFLINGQEKAFQFGINALKKLTTGKVHLGVNAAFPINPVYAGAQDVEITQYQGKHPAGNVGVQIHHTNPILKGDVIWYMNPTDVVQIGKLFLNGEPDFTRIVALVGSEVKDPCYYRTHIGATVKSIADGKISNTNARYISGNVLTGTQVSPESYLGFYDQQITVIPEGNRYNFLGWAMPNLDKFSMSRTFFSWLSPKKKYALDTNFNGGERAFVMTGEYEKVFPMEILPVHLLKSILAEDIEKMEKLGIYEVAPEDFALCEFVCTSKIESQAIVRKGLDLMLKEMS